MSEQQLSIEGVSGLRGASYLDPRYVPTPCEIFGGADIELYHMSIRAAGFAREAERQGIKASAKWFHSLAADLEALRQKMLSRLPEDQSS